MQILYRRWFLLTVAWLNFVGTIWGFYWYRYQLAATQWWQWPIIVDSPLHALFFSAFLYILAAKRAFSIWTGLVSWIAAIGVIKYGVWAVCILVRYLFEAGEVPSIEDVLLIAGHIGMAVEGMLYAHLLPKQASLVGWCSVWFMTNDYCDYVYKLHPYLPNNSLFFFAELVDVGLTFLLIGSGLVLTAKKYKKKCKTP